MSDTKPVFRIFFRQDRAFMIAMNLIAYAIAPIYEVEEKKKLELPEDWSLSQPVDDFWVSVNIKV